MLLLGFAVLIASMVCSDELHKWIRSRPQGEQDTVTLPVAFHLIVFFCLGFAEVNRWQTSILLFIVF